MVVVEARVLGKQRSLVPEWSVPIPTPPADRGHSGWTLRQLIQRIVRAEVAEFDRRQEARTFVRALSAREVAAGAERGKVDPGGHARGKPADTEAAVAAALQAFEDGLYLVLVDGKEQRELDREVHVGDQSRVMFLRLSMLAGG